MTKRDITPPKKLNIPILLKASLALWATTALIYTNANLCIADSELNLSKTNDLFKILDFDLLPYVLVAIILSISIILCQSLIKHSLSAIKIIICFALIGVVIGAIGASNYQKAAKNILSENNDYCVFEAVEDQKASTLYNNCEATIIEGTKESYNVVIQVEKDFDEIHAGDIIKAQSKFSSPPTALKESYYKNGNSACAKLSNPEKLKRNDLIGAIYNFRNKIISTIRDFNLSNESIYDDSCALLSAIICGFKIELSNTDLYESFKNAGLAHLVAVSGAHLSLVCTILLIFLKKFKLKRNSIVIIQSFFIFAYLYCAAIPISALRSAFMAYIAIFSFFTKTRPAPLNALGLCIIIFIAISPTTSVSVSFALSAGSTLGILVFSSLFQYLIGRVSPKCPEFIKSATSLTFAANTCSLPLSISIFNQISIIAPLSNIICTPLFTLLCGYGMLSCLFSTIMQNFLPILSYVMLWITNIISSILAFTTTALASIPFSAIPASINIYLAIFVSFLICLFLYRLWPKTDNKNNNLLNKNKKIYFNKKPSDDKNYPYIPILQKKKYSIFLIASSVIAIFTVLFFVNFTFGSSDSEIIMFNVGQGDSILLKSENRKILIDTGNQDSMLKQRLAENDIKYLDGLMITHPDDDHCGSLDVIENLIEVGEVYVAKDLKNCSDDKAIKLMSNLKKIVSDDKIKCLSVGDQISLGEMRLNIIWPDKYEDNGGNGDSLCVDAEIDINKDNIIDAKCLLCGDAEKDEIQQMIEKNRINKLDLYKVGHHGSKNALDSEQSRILSPEISLISVGEKNRYGHPSKQTLENLRESEIFRTDQDGTIKCIFHLNKIEISTQQ